MDVKNKGFFIIMFLMLSGGIGYAYWHYVIDRDFLLVNRIDCDPTVEACYVWECDPEAAEGEDACTGDVEEDIWYYKIVERMAKNVPTCSSDDENCDAFVCPKNEDGCREIVCEEGTAEEESAACSYPTVYNAEHPEVNEEDEEGVSEGDMVQEDLDEDGVEEEDVSIDGAQGDNGDGSGKTVKSGETSEGDVMGNNSEDAQS